MKQLISILLSALILISVFAVPAFAADTQNSPTCDDYINWYCSGTGLYISGRGPMPDYKLSGEQAAPWAEYSDIIEKVDIGDGLTTIGECAFNYFTKLSEVILPDSVTSIKSRAFSGCESLKTMNIPSKVSEISINAFDYTNIEEYFVPENNPVFYTISGNLYKSDAYHNAVLFKYANGKTETSFTIPSTVTVIYEGAIDGTNLETINIPASLTYLDEYPIWNNKKLKAVNVDSDNTNFFSEDGVFFERDYCGRGLGLVVYPDAKSGKSYTVPSGVKVIGDCAFSFNKNLQSVTLSDSVELLWSYAFFECNNLKTVDLAKVKEFYQNVFYGSAITSLYLPKTITKLEPYSIGMNVDWKPDKNFKAYYVKGTPAASIIENYCKEAGVNGVAVTIPSASLKAGGTKTLKPAAGKITSWSSSKKAVATVKNGKVTALKKGTATITAKLYDGAKITSKITIKTSPKLNKPSVTVEKGKTVKVKITGKASTVKNKYTNTKTAKITSKNTATTLTVKGLKKGKTTLKVKVNGVVLKLKVVVK